MSLAADHRAARPRHYVMCPPTYFDVRYAINAWMDPTVTVNLAVAHRQWDTLRQTYLGLGHRVELMKPHPDLPDMVFTANGALVVGNRAVAAHFAHEQRRPEAVLHEKRLRAGGLRSVLRSTHRNEGEGDFLLTDDLILAGTGFRTDHAAHRQVQDFLGRPVLTLDLCDPRFYHLDTALAVLGRNDIAYYPGAFAPASRATLARVFPDAVLADEQNALAFGLNAVSDGHNVMLPAAASGLARALRERGYAVHPVDLSELLKAGGSVKCVTMEIHP